MTLGYANIALVLVSVLVGQALGRFMLRQLKKLDHAAWDVLELLRDIGDQPITALAAFTGMTEEALETELAKLEERGCVRLRLVVTPVAMMRTYRITEWGELELRRREVVA